MHEQTMQIAATLTQGRSTRGNFWSGLTSNLDRPSSAFRRLDCLGRKQSSHVNAIWPNPQRRGVLCALRSRARFLVYSSTVRTYKDTLLVAYSITRLRTRLGCCRQNMAKHYGECQLCSQPKKHCLDSSATHRGCCGGFNSYCRGWTKYKSNGTTTR